MKQSIFLILAVILIGCRQESNTRFRSEIVNLFEHEGEYHVGGYAVGYDGSPSPFYLVAHKVAKEESKETILEMLNDPNSAVRATGLVALAIKKEKIPELKRDRASIAVFSGCVGGSMDLEKFSTLLRNDQEFRREFTHELKKELSNQAAHTTPAIAPR